MKNKNKEFTKLLGEGMFDVLNSSSTQLVCAFYLVILLFIWLLSL